MPPHSHMDNAKKLIMSRYGWLQCIATRVLRPATVFQVLRVRHFDSSSVVARYIAFRSPEGSAFCSPINIIPL